MDTDVFWIGNKALSGCIACTKCREQNQCVFDDPVNEFLEIAGDYDGFIFGSPVHWGGSDLCQTRRNNSHLGSDEQIFWLDADVDRYLQILEYGAWHKSGIQLYKFYPLRYIPLSPRGILYFIKYQNAVVFALLQA